MLSNEIVRKIEDFVYAKPRSIQEISQHLGKNWRTVDRYVEEIIREYGTLDKRIFREGTRGALKIIYWAAVEKLGHSVFQEEMEKKIFAGQEKNDFSVFDIFQHVDDRNKRAIMERKIDENSTNLQEFKEILLGAKKKLMMFSGNLSFANLKNKNFDMMEIFEELIRRNVKVEIVAKVDLTGKENIEKVLALNYKYGVDAIEVRHREQPLRAIVVDEKILRLKEVKEPTGKINELDKKVYIFYTIKDVEWASWIARIFRKMFSSSIGSEKRLSEMGKII